MSTRVAYSLVGQGLENLELLENLLSAPPSEKNWFLFSWDAPEKGLGTLSVGILVPPDQLQAESTEEFLEKVGLQLEGALGQFCSDRGWPQPRFQLHPEASPDGEWSYLIRCPECEPIRNVFKPNKLLAVGEPSGLARFLGLETTEPVFGLNAKWIGQSQLEAALHGGLTVFDAPGVIAAHVLHLVGDHFHSLIGFWELQRWLQTALPEVETLLAPLLKHHAGLLLRLVKDLISEGLWLPHPARFVEQVAMSLPEFEPQDGTDPDMVREMVRKELIPLNLERWTNEHGELEAVAWKGDLKQDQASQTRILVRLATALSRMQEAGLSGVPAVITDIEQRWSVAEGLRALFPQLPVLSWAELPPHAHLKVQATVDTELPLDFGEWDSAHYEIGTES